MRGRGIEGEAKEKREFVKRKNKERNHKKCVIDEKKNNMMRSRGKEGKII